MLPERMLEKGAISRLAPRSVMLATATTLIKSTIEADSRATPIIERPNRIAASSPAGGFRLQAPRPSRGISPAATMNISAARGATRAALQATARAYHQP